MIRRIIEINEEKCTGCGICADACHEGAIVIIGGKAKLIKDDYCDGMGDCLPHCPQDAIKFVEREANSYDESAVRRNKELRAKLAKMIEESKNNPKMSAGCPGSRIKQFDRASAKPLTVSGGKTESALRQWPVQIKLVPITAPYFDGCDLLIAADCTAYAYADFHRDFISGRITLIGCPKLDSIDYSEKLGQIMKSNDIKSVTVTRMEVPCCGGLENAVRKAIAFSGKHISLNVVTISSDGNII